MAHLVKPCRRKVARVFQGQGIRVAYRYAARDTPAQVSLDNVGFRILDARRQDAKPFDVSVPVNNQLAARVWRFDFLDRLHRELQFGHVILLREFDVSKTREIDLFPCPMQI
jgi:hypothetical protein